VPLPSSSPGSQNAEPAVSQINPEYLFLFARAIRNWYSVEPGLYGCRERTKIKARLWVEAPAFHGRGDESSFSFFQRFSAGVMAVAFPSAQRLRLHAHGSPSSGAGWPGYIRGRILVNAPGALSAWQKLWGTPGRFPFALSCNFFPFRGSNSPVAFPGPGPEARS
jgi:hypothetical protein